MPGNTDSIRRWSDDALLALLRDAHRALSEPLSAASVRRWADGIGRAAPTERTYTVHFGSWIAACDAAAVPHAHDVGAVRPGPRPVSVDECRRAVGAFVQRCRSEDVAPTMERYQLLSREEGWPTRNTITHRLGASWSDIIAAARKDGRSTNESHEPVTRAIHPRRKHERPPGASDILAALRAAASLNGGRLTVSDYRRWSADRRAVPHPDAIRARFGSWAAACRAAGALPGRGGWTVLDVIEQLQRAYDELGEPFTGGRFRAWAATQPPPNALLRPDVAIRAIGSWSACQQAAGAAVASATDAVEVVAE